ncbi:nitrilase-related carbon-nitrogen hydrolase [Streptomyces sp. NPDC059810]|uniref:carbon-nitrogen hydrolase family protein n=1 Tax=Streptomyces sp. NPDC059810 TaxID=3346956 RepID=UPI00364FA739
MVLERAENGRVHNAAVVYDPRGELVARYRKVFTWRPYEPIVPRREFVAFDMPSTGPIGLSICYESCYSEATRHLAWLGAELAVNLVQTPTSGRAQGIPVNQANAIVNQIWVASVNGAGPTAQAAQPPHRPRGPHPGRRGRHGGHHAAATSAGPAPTAPLWNADGTTLGVSAAYSYLGFDAVTTLSEEARDPDVTRRRPRRTALRLRLVRHATRPPRN